jgi:hypothetical protein
MSLHVSIVGQDSKENIGSARNIIDDDSDDELVKVDGNLTLFLYHYQMELQLLNLIIKKRSMLWLKMQFW